MADNPQGKDTDHGTKPRLVVVAGTDALNPKPKTGPRSGNKTANGKAGLTIKQERFSELLAQGLSNADAYRGAYNTENMQANTIHTEASKLANNPIIADRVGSLLAEKKGKQGMLTLKQSERIWKGVWDLAESATTPPAVKASALQLAAKMAGMLTDQVKIESSPDSKSIESELLERLRKLSA